MSYINNFRLSLLKEIKLDISKSVDFNKILNSDKYFDIFIQEFKNTSRFKSLSQGFYFYKMKNLSDNYRNKCLKQDSIVDTNQEDPDIKKMRVIIFFVIAEFLLKYDNRLLLDFVISDGSNCEKGFLKKIKFNSNETRLEIKKIDFSVKYSKYEIPLKIDLKFINRLFEFFDDENVEDVIEYICHHIYNDYMKRIVLKLDKEYMHYKKFYGSFVNNNFDTKQVCVQINKKINELISIINVKNSTYSNILLLNINNIYFDFIENNPTLFDAGSVYLSDIVPKNKIFLLENNQNILRDTGSYILQNLIDEIKQDSNGYLEFFRTDSIKITRPETIGCLEIELK